MIIFNKKRGITNNKFHNLNQNSNLHICMVILKKIRTKYFSQTSTTNMFLKKNLKKKKTTTTTNLTNLKTS